MNPYQVMGLIACCVALFAGTVTFLTAQGVPLPAAFLCVYVVAIGCMMCMQRRARASCEERLERRRGRGEQDPLPTEPRLERLDVDSGADTADALFVPRERFRT